MAYVESQKAISSLEALCGFLPNDLRGKILRACELLTTRRPSEMSIKNQIGRNIVEIKSESDAFILRLTLFPKEFRENTSIDTKLDLTFKDCRYTYMLSGGKPVEIYIVTTDESLSLYHNYRSGRTTASADMVKNPKSVYLLSTEEALDSFIDQINKPFLPVAITQSEFD